MTPVLEDPAHPNTYFLCAECGDETRPRTREEEERGLCWNCAFWQTWVERKDHPAYREHIVRIGANHYLLAPEDSFARPRGLCGTRLAILFKDGRRVETSNLWHQGVIPMRWRIRLPDNATFVAAGGG